LDNSAKNEDKLLILIYLIGSTSTLRSLTLCSVLSYGTAKVNSKTAEEPPKKRKSTSVVHGFLYSRREKNKDHNKYKNKNILLSLSLFNACELKARAHFVGLVGWVKN
jgi:hypothetical protein